MERISLFLILLTFTFLLNQKIDLTTADLGRHLKNGQMFFENFTIPQTNLYSYTQTDYPFVNHHWGSGVIFYLIHQLTGFTGLSIFFIILSLITFCLFFRLACKYGGFQRAVLLSIIFLPLLIHRREIRPEIFSYLFSGLFFWLLLNYQKDRLGQKWLVLLPFIELFWVNLHIYFPLGLSLIAVFLLQNIVNFMSKKQENSIPKIKKLGLLLTAASLVTLLNPNGLTGALYPLRIFDNFGYRLVENQSLFFIEKISSYPAGVYFKIALTVVILSWIYCLITHFKQKPAFSLANFLISLTFTALALKAIRNFTIFAYFSLPITAINLKPGQFKQDKNSHYLFITTAVILSIFIFLINLSYWQNQTNKGFGLQTDSLGAITFFQKESLQGPIFNNYDIGGYLIYFLYPKEKVFVDNRPEAYPQDFFNQTYIPMQETEIKWRQIDQQYNFQTIFFYRHDFTPWGQSFLIRRVSDQDWAPVFVDNKTIIFLKRNGANQPIIDKYELPLEIFSIKKLK